MKDEIKEIVKEELDELRNKPQLKKEEDATYDEDADEFEEGKRFFALITIFILLLKLK